MTAKDYPRIEADGFAGRDEPVFTEAGLTAALGRYDRTMGPVNHDLVIAHHRANVHAQELVSLFERLGPKASAPRAPLEDMARLVRLEWRARAQVHGLQVENADLHRRVGEIGLKLTELDEVRKVESELRKDGERRAEQAARRAETAERRSKEVVDAYESTLSWRMTRPLRSLGGRRRVR